MNRKKIAIIGKGTAGSITATMLRNEYPLEIDWYFDPETPEQAVGEGSTLYFPKFLHNNFNLINSSLKDLLDGTYKNSIRKINYNGSGDYHHSFSLGNSGIHFNAYKFQKLVQQSLAPHVNIISKQITDHSQIDANYIVDCSGKPKNLKDYIKATSIPVNSAHIVQCEWKKPEFNYTLTIARPYGWVFGIPLQNRCSIGYLYNKDINTLEEVQEDIKEIFKQFNLTPSTQTKSFNFSNYYRKENFTDRVAYNGNSSFFLEPLEATSIDTMFNIISNIKGIIKGDITKQEADLNYHSFIQASEQMIAMHYFAGSKFKTPFWEYAHNNSLSSIEKMTSHPKFRWMFEEVKLFNRFPTYDTFTRDNFGTWGSFSFYQNIHNLGIFEKINQFHEKNNKPNLIY